MMIAEEEFWMDFESSDLTFKMFVGVRIIILFSAFMSQQKNVHSLFTVRF